MLEKMQKALIKERIPVVLCAAACLASVFMGFVLGYAFFDSGPSLVYGDTAAVYQSGIPPLVITSPEINAYDLELPTQSSAQPYNEPAAGSQAASHLYVVTVLGGYIAIYHAEESGGGLKEVTSTAVGNLAPEELELLQAGIKIYSDEALVLILQDYGS